MANPQPAQGEAAEPNNNIFSLPVDSEHKATQLRIFNTRAPHIRAFHLSWLSFFACFVSSFAAPPLLPVIRDNLNLSASEITKAGIGSVSGAIFARLVMGTACDLYGPRLASSALILITAPAVYLTSLSISYEWFFVVRFFTGFSLATFVSTQFWMSSMFSSNVVGTANAVAAGWGNLGGGATQLIMPHVHEFISRMGGLTSFTSWRIAFFVPALLQTLSAYAVFFLGQDLPDGNYTQLHHRGDMHEDKVSKVLLGGLKNYRGWILALTYGYCFGIELTIDNIIAQYFYDRFNLNLQNAGMIAASFGLANLLARPLGGMLSDVVAARFGMRGRLWTLWAFQTLGGVFCLLLGRVGSLSVSILVMIIFSLFVQASCGLTFGIVPFVSRRSLGIISGMTGAGGNLGAVITQLAFFCGSRHTTETGLTLMGGTIICVAQVVSFIHFPQWGGMFHGPSSPHVTEEEYYLSEWTEEERERGYHTASLRFAENSRNERSRRNREAPAPAHV